LALNFVPPPPSAVPDLMSDLERLLHAPAPGQCLRRKTDLAEHACPKGERLCKIGYRPPIRPVGSRGLFMASRFTLRADTHARLAAPGDVERDRRMDWEAAKTRVLSVLKQRAAHGEPGLSNADVRRITGLNRNQVVRLMVELRTENPAISEPGRGRFARYDFHMEANDGEH